MLPMKHQPQRRKLSSSHFAFMRALAQGLDQAESWDRYLAVDGSSADARVVKSTVRWIRDEFAAAARRQGRPGTARIVKLDPSLLPRGQLLPSLEEFAIQRGMEDFSESEQTEAYAETYGQASSADTKRMRQRGRLIKRQLDGLNWLEKLVAEYPAAGDPVDAWLAPVLANRLQAAGIPTLFTLAERINGMGQGWFRGIPAIGASKAARIVRWVQENQTALGVPMGSHVGKPRGELTRSELAAVVSPGSELLPLEKFQIPANLDGSHGAFRGDPRRCLLTATNDHQAIMAWLSSKHSDQVGQLSSTQRSYRKEAERLLLWAVLQRGKPLSSLTVEDAGSYLGFLREPPANWCGPRHHQRWSPLWRPLEGPLTPTAQVHTVTVLRILYSWLTTQGYLVGNPFAAVSLPRKFPRPLGSGRVISLGAMDFVMHKLGRLEDSSPNRRLQLALPWLYASGLRLSEIVNARCGHLSHVEYIDAQGELASGWLQTVIGKGGRPREVPVPEDLVKQLVSELLWQGREGDVSDPANAEMPILARYDTLGMDILPLPVAAGGLYKLLKRFFSECADEMAQTDPAAAQRLRKASSHWLRHSHASHAVNGRPGAPGVPVQIMQQNLGHASLA
ncbi:MAG: phage integrase family protein, partial [Pseudomonadota bacterium]